VTIPAPADHSNDGAHIVQYRSTDAAGNVEATKSATIIIDTVAPRTTIGGVPSGSSSAPVTLTFTAADNTGGSGMSGGSAKTEYNIDGKGWVTGTSVTIPAPADQSNNGAHTVQYRSTDAAGNVEATQSVTVTIKAVPPDSTPPTTTVSGLPSGPTNASVTLTFTAIDNAGGSGMSGGSAKTEYNLDGKGWVTGMSVTIPAPADHSGDGSHVVFYRSVDAAGNVETAKNASIDVDTVAPTTTAWNAKGRLRASITLKFEVDHPASASASGIRVVVSDNRGRSVKVFTVGTRSTGVVYSVKWKPRARGTYTYCVYVDADDAGNRQSAVGTAKVLVK
jgi:hypothetical protein